MRSRRRHYRSGNLSTRSLMRAISMIALLAIVPASSFAQYRITHTYTLGGDGSWDYVVPDAPNHRVFIGRHDRVMVVDTRDGKLLGEVKGINGAHGTAIVQSAG